MKFNILDQNKIIQICLFMFALFSLNPNNVSAASFNCHQAMDEDEIAICNNSKLNDMDVILSTKYDFLKGLYAMGWRDVMENEQRDWLSKRKLCGKNVGCLENVYTNRIHELDVMYEKIDKPL